jgi:hypothetical protein
MLRSIAAVRAYAYSIIASVSIGALPDGVERRGTQGQRPVSVWGLKLLVYEALSY